MDDDKQAVSVDVPTNRSASGVRTYLLTVLSITLVLFLNACATTQSDLETPPAVSSSVLALHNEGDAFVQQKDLERATDRYRAALTQAKSIGDELGIAMSLAGLGAIYGEQKRHSDAAELLQEALVYFRKLKNRPSEALTLAAIGTAEWNRGNDAQALTYFAEGLEIAERLFPSLNDSQKQILRSHRAGVLVLKANSAEKLSRFSEAVESYQAAAKDFLALDNKESAASQLWAAAELSSKTGATGEALELFREASAIYQTAGNIRNALWTKIGMGMAQFALRRYQDALATLSEGSFTAEREGLSDVAANTMFFLAEIDENLGEFENALTKYRSALQNYRKGVGQEDPTLEPRILLRMGKIYRLRDNYEEGVEHFRLAISKSRAANARAITADALMSLAEVFYWLADARLSIPYYKQAFDLFSQDGDGPKQVEILATLGELGFLSDEISAEDGLAYFKKAATVAGQFVKMADLGKSDTRRYDHGDSKWRSALSLFFQKFGRAALVRKDFDWAIRLLNEAWLFHINLPTSRDNSFERAKDLFFLAEAHYEKKDVTSALKYLQMAEQIATRLRTPEIHWVYARMGRVYAQLGDSEKARQYYQRGLELLESIQAEQRLHEFKIAVFGGAISAYWGFVEFLFDLNQKRHDVQLLYDAFHYNERGRARVFLEMLGNARARYPDNQQNLASKQDDGFEQVAKIHQRLRDPKLDSKTEIELLDELTRVRDLRRNAQQAKVSRQENYALPRPVTGPQLQAVLDSDSVVLEYAPASQQTLLWAITKDQFKAYKLEDKEGAALVQKYLRTLHAPLVGADEIRNHIDLGRRLYRMLVEPAAEIIRDKRHLIIVPAGLLSYLPFESLNVPGNEKSLSDVQYLINKFEITYAPSASVLVAQRTNPEANRKGKRFPLVAFGDPIYETEEPSSVANSQETKIENLALRGLDLRRLEFSGDEVLRIAQIWDVNPNSEHINLRDKATVDRLRKMDLTKYRIVHFAAHAVLADEVKRILQPALLLSQTGHNDTTANRLQFSDILGLELNADLVVLSACDTALGQLKNGEGIVGLTRAFLYAGASSTVVSLWKVEDQSTSLLMESFYQNLKRGLSKAEALRQAKLATMHSTIDLKATGMRQDLASPFFWAPFILVGDWGPIQAN